MQGTGNVVVNITAINDAPLLVTNNPLSVPEESTRTITAAYLQVTDADHSATQIVYTLISLPSGGSVRLNGSSLTIGQTFTQDDINNNRVTYRDSDEGASASFQFTVTDGVDVVGPYTFSVNGQPTNDAPVNTLPANRYTSFNTAVTFSGAGGNAIQISDIDAGINPVQVTLSATNGNLTLGSTAGLTLVSGANGSSTFTYSGTISALNAALNGGVTFNPTTAYRGLAQITVTTNDLGNSGSGGALSDTDTIKVHVGALVVTNLTDTINGNTSSIANLVASDGGDGISLREAILAANATLNVGGPDHIYFNITGAGPHVINLSSALPAINSPVIIDASSEPDYSGTPVVVLNGGGIVQDGIRLLAGSDGSTVRGLSIQNFTQTVSILTTVMAIPSSATGSA